MSSDLGDTAASRGGWNGDLRGPAARRPGRGARLRRDRARVFDVPEPAQGALGDIEDRAARGRFGRGDEVAEQPPVTQPTGPEE